MKIVKTYPRPPKQDYNHRASLTEGRLPEAFGWRSGVRRPRASLASLHSGGAGAPPGDTTVPCLEQADDLGWNTQAKARPGAGRKTPRWSAERRAPYVIGRVASRKARLVERLSALRPPRLFPRGERPQSSGASASRECPRVAV